MRSSLLGIVALAAGLAFATPTFATPPPKADSPTVMKAMQPMATIVSGQEMHTYAISTNLVLDQVLVPQTTPASRNRTMASLLLGATTFGRTNPPSRKEGAAFAAESVGAGLGSPAGYFTG